MKLKDRVALITGSSRGIGKAIAQEFAKEGADVVVNYNSSEDEAVRLVEEIKAMGRRSIAVKADVAKVDEIYSMVDEALSEFGRIDVLVNNAGIHQRVSLFEITEEVWDREIDVNLKGAFFCTIATAKHMLERKSGKIINLASVSGWSTATAGTPHYTASKMGIVGLTRSFAVNFAPYITVNALAPALVLTDLQKSYTKEQIDRYIQSIPLKRPATAQEVAKAALFLASADADFITGQTLFVAGGFVVH